MTAVPSPENFSPDLVARLRNAAPAWQPVPDLGERLAALLARARASRPEVSASDEGFLAQLMRHLTPPEADEAYVGDLYLATACLEGKPAALSRFRSELLSELRRYLARAHGSEDFADEVVQALSERVLLRGPDGRTRLAEYTGRGELMGWLRVGAIRLALNMKRDAEPPATGDFSSTAAEADLELDVLKAQYRAPFARALTETLRSLPQKQRNVLRLHSLDGLTVDRIGKMFRVDKSTISRWISAARAAIFERTRQELQKHFAVSDSELDTVMGVLNSRYDVSVSRFLHTPSR
jgi:RNA polymerase sigma-70 factor (ECF subfamily)